MLVPKQAGKLLPGVPQYEQPHLLVAGGLKANENMLPGFRAELVHRRGIEVDILKNAHLLYHGVMMPCGDSNVKISLKRFAFPDSAGGRFAPPLRFDIQDKAFVHNEP